MTRPLDPLRGLILTSALLSAVVCALVIVIAELAR